MQWLDSLERFGIVSPRGVLLEGSTLQQNLAMPFTLAIDPVPPAVAEQVAERGGAVRHRSRPLARRLRAGELPRRCRVRAHLARALALNPDFVVIEHPDRGRRACRPRRGWPRTWPRACAERGVTTLVLTNDDAVCEGGRAAQPEAPRRDRGAETVRKRLVRPVSRPLAAPGPSTYFTVMVIFCDTIGFSCGMCRASPRTSCSVCLPGGSVSSVSVWPAAEVPDVVGHRQRRVEVGRLGQVDQQVMVAGVRLVHAGRRDAHALEAEADRYRRRHRFAVLWRQEIDGGVLRRLAFRHLGDGGARQEGRARDAQVKKGFFMRCILQREESYAQASRGIQCPKSRVASPCLNSSSSISMERSCSPAAPASAP